MHNQDLRAEALQWHAEHPDLPTSAFACRFPGMYKEAAVAIRVVRILDADATDEDLPMSLSIEQQLELKRAEHARTVADLLATVELLDYYRSQITQTNGSRVRPPAGYWIKEAKTGFVWGMLSDGDLLPEGKGRCYESTVEKCWAHYDKLHDNRQIKKPRPSTAHIDKRTLQKSTAPEEPEEVDLDDLDEEPEETPAPTRRRRRRVIND